MIPRPYIVEWQEHAPWKSFDQIEQDLIISRTLVVIFSDDFLKENLAFRGGTALHKLYLNPAPRYSEDIDLVQIKPGPIKPIMQRLGEIIDFFEEPRRTEVRGHGAKALYRFASEYGNTRRRLKLEINCKEHFNVLDWIELPFEIKNRWFSGEARIRTYNLNELLGTKLRALYQRSKGRDLFDLDYSHLHMSLDTESIIQCFKEYMIFSIGKPPSQKEFLINIEEKENDINFTGDMEGLLRLGIGYDQELAFEWLKENLIGKL
ncbi:nucleotidyl transferase AbiEii/AbiGii toxin family protein [Muricauda sp. ANG21]|uniref:nucleotidyl transferase AbiEii/AbiGii toxin family protein n=1 Tax=Allomuricauda sp. ANG21 TaxID=3042468 RepID=UPI003451FD02